MRTALGAALLAAGPALAADPPALDLPIACNVGQGCYIQNYVDADPGSGARDFRCHTLTYDGHKGTDFALPTRTEMAAGVAVLAAAPGRVLSLRDGMDDGGYLTDRAAVDGRECGNGVVIDHGDGWHSQYCHLKKDSVTVRRGQSVAAGTPLGRVGLSGKTEFPHLHFSVRHQGRTVDPFDPDAAAACASPPQRGLWRDPPPAYIPGGVLAAGFAPALPDYAAIKAGTAAHAELPAAAPALVLWGFAFGARAGDLMLIEIDGPDGYRHARRITLEKPIAQFFRASGQRRPDRGWQPGEYRGHVSLFRDGRTISQRGATVTIRP